MDAAQVTELVKEALPGCEVQVQVDGNHYLVVVVGDVFEGLPTIKRQQMINKVLFQHVMDGTIQQKSLLGCLWSPVWPRSCFWRCR